MSSLTNEYPTASNITWSRNASDSSQYSARYKAGADWIIASYNTTGNRLDRRTEIPLQQLPQSVNNYIKSQQATFQAVNVNRLQAQGKAEVYEIKSKEGRIIYIDENGREVNW